MTDEEHKKALEQAIAANDLQWKNRLASEQVWGEIGRAVVVALRSRNPLLPSYPKLGSGLDRLAAKYVVMGQDFDTLMAAVNKDVMLTSAWEQFAMYLRLSQGDDNGEEE